MWCDPVHKLLSTSWTSEEWAWLHSAHHHQGLSPGQKAPVLTCPRIQCCSGLDSSWDTPWCDLCGRHNIYLSSTQMVSTFLSPGLHRHLQIIEAGKIHGRQSKSMMCKVSNCWLICEIMSGVKSTWPVRNMHVLPKQASRFCQLWNWILERNVIYLLKTRLIGNSTLTVAKVLSRAKSEREIILRKKPVQIRYIHTHTCSLCSQGGESCAHQVKQTHIC